MLRGWSANLRSFATVSVIVLTSTSLHAALITLTTPAGATTGGQPVSAKVTFTTSANQVGIVLQNLQPDPASVVQCLSGLQFTLGSGQTTGTLTASSGMERSIDSTGAFTDGSLAPLGWDLSTVGSSLKLNLLGTPTAPMHTIIGPPDGANIYASGNGSIRSGAHSPFIGLSASFTLNVPGVTAQSTISSAIFQFNTAGNNNVTGTPEPGTLALAGLAACGAMVRRKR
jgi:hypothetical protein